MGFDLGFLIFGLVGSSEEKIKRMSFWKIFGVMAAAWLLAPARARADVQLAPLFGNGAVLQRDAPVNVWGTGSDGEVVTVRLGRQVAQTTTRDGRWLVRFEPFEATRQDLTLSASGSNLVSAQVAIGEVWLCSGQSNMEMLLANTENGREVASRADDSQLRVFRVARATASQPKPDVSGAWRAATPSNAGGFSAVAFYFGRYLRAKLGVPIGLVVPTWSATRAEAWTSLPALQQLNAQIGGVDAQLPSGVLNAETSAAQTSSYNAQLSAWQNAGNPPVPDDLGVASDAQGWASPGLNTSDWKPTTVPGAWENSGDFADGARWFRFELTLGSDWDKRDAMLSLGAIDDFDQTFVNGERVGAIGPETSRFWIAPRRYAVPGRLLHAGRNTIAVRVFDHGGQGGFMAAPNELRLERVTAGEASMMPVSISLAGTWLSKWERRVPSKPVAPPMLDPNAPSALYNGMIAPLSPLSIRGFAWYQGEANVSEAWRYTFLLPALIADWRRAWSRGDLPFYVVQLAPFAAKPSNVNALNFAPVNPAPDTNAISAPTASPSAPKVNAPIANVANANVANANAPTANATSAANANAALANITSASASTSASSPTASAAVSVPTNSGALGDGAWAELREAQRQTALRVGQTAQVVILDADISGDLHPRRKVRVGERLALAALANTYGRRLEWSGPQPESVTVRDGEVQLRFSHARGLRTSDGGNVQGFTLAGSDRVFYPAQARIEGESVRLSSPNVPAPVAARYAWADFPVFNLQNNVGLPATPFRTDDFPLSTQPVNVPPPIAPQLIVFSPAPPLLAPIVVAPPAAASRAATPPVPMRSQLSNGARSKASRSSVTPASIAGSSIAGSSIARSKPAPANAVRPALLASRGGGPRTTAMSNKAATTQQTARKITSRVAPLAPKSAPK